MAGCRALVVAGCHKESEMPRSILEAHVGAFLDEFPFLRPYIDLNPWSEKPGMQPVGVEGIGEKPTVQRIDFDLLECEPYRDYTGASRERFLLLDVDGYLLTEVKANERRWVPFSWRRFWNWGWSEGIPSETVLEAINRLGDPDRLGYILELQPLGRTFVLHKAPSGQSVSSWVWKNAAEALKDELAEIDS